MLLLGLYVLSLFLSGMIFVILLGRDAWIIKGLRRDEATAIVVACLLLVTGLALSAGLRTLLSKIPHALAKTLTSVPQWSPDVMPAAAETPLADATGWFLGLCAPVLASLLLYGLYHVGLWVVRCLSSNEIDEAVAIKSNRQ